MTHPCFVKKTKKNRSKLSLSEITESFIHRGKEITLNILSEIPSIL